MTAITPPVERLNTLIPSETSSERDFDFLVGHWHIHNKKLKSRLDNCSEWDEFNASQETRSIVNGLGVIDKFVSTIHSKPFEGLTLRLFNPETRLWSIYWADSNHPYPDTPVVGSFHQHVGEFTRKEEFKGIEVLIRYRWDNTNPEKPMWSQAYSPDNGDTWEWNWYMQYVRI